MTLNEKGGTDHFVTEHLDIDTSLQNLQVLQALKYLQNPSSGLLNNLLPPLGGSASGLTVGLI